MTKLISTAAVVAIIAAATASAAHAQEQRLNLASRTITYHTRDLADPAGAARMLRRIEYVAGVLCASNSPIVRHQDAQSRNCRAKTVAGAVATLDAPMVTAAYEVRRREVAAR